jgi:hypothetical protein
MNVYYPFGKPIQPSDEQVQIDESKFKQYDYYGITYGDFDTQDNSSEQQQKDIAQARQLILNNEAIQADLSARLLKYKAERELADRLSIMMDVLTQILKCSQSEAHNIIINSETYKWLVDKDYSTLYDSPQANLSSIGQELREHNNSLGRLITDENITTAILKLRNKRV